jgi:hypothetical protein
MAIAKLMQIFEAPVFVVNIKQKTSINPQWAKASNH